jgi:hypothetical protein
VTGADSTAKLLLKDQSVIDVSPNTSFRIESLDDGAAPDRKAEVQADFGQVRASVNRKLSQKGKFLLRTPSTLMAVRGTEWVAASTPNKGGNQTKESVTVLGGKVEVRDVAGKEEPVILERGNRMNIYLEFAIAKIAEIVRKAINGEKAEAANRRHEVQTLKDAELELLMRESRLEEHTARQLVVLDDHGGGDATLHQVNARVRIPEALPLPGASIDTPAGPPPLATPAWRR